MTPPQGWERGARPAVPEDGPLSAPRRPETGGEPPRLSRSDAEVVAPPRPLPLADRVPRRERADGTHREPTKDQTLDPASAFDPIAADAVPTARPPHAGAAHPGPEPRAGDGAGPTPRTPDPRALDRPEPEGGPGAASPDRSDGPARRDRGFERRVILLAVGFPAPLVALALALLAAADLSPPIRWSLATLTVGWWFTAAFLLRDRVVRPVQTLSNLLAALREGDFSIRARDARGDDALGLALMEINTLSEVLREQRLGALEATALLRGVMDEIDVAVFAFDSEQRLRLINRAGERLLGEPAARIVGSRADDLELRRFLEGAAARTTIVSFPGGSGPWELRRTPFMQGGRPHQLVVLSDLSRALREEERQAWQRLIRVLSHEINNSLTPIQSIAGSIRDLIRPGAPDPGPEDREDIRQGLAVIQNRSASLSRFLASYARLTRLPPPEPRPVDVATWVSRNVALESRMQIAILPGPRGSALAADPDQLDQLLINILRNAVDAALETGGSVSVGWRERKGNLELEVLDEGPGIPHPANLFVPFYTTKPGGSGIGLALSRQIAEGHGGRLVLENRADRRGCRAVVTLPLPEPVDT